MSMKSNLAKQTLLVIMTCWVSAALAAEQPIIINNNNNNSSGQGANNCDPQAQNDTKGTPPGTYYRKTPQGSDTIYTTGEKKPYIVENPCNQQNVAQPFVYTYPGPYYPLVTE